VSEANGARLRFLCGTVGPGFERRVVTIPAGESRGFDEAEWRDAIVVLAGGQIELECVNGTSRLFATGAVLWLVGLSVCALHNPGPVPAILVAVSRATPNPPTTPPEQ